jgi:hypothetical protein
MILVNKANNALILLGLLVSVGISIFAAQPRGDNSLYLLNRIFRDSSTHMKLLLPVCVICSIAAAAAYVEAVVFSASSTSALIFIVMPGYQMFFLFIILVISLVLRRSIRGKPG